MKVNSSLSRIMLVLCLVNLVTYVSLNSSRKDSSGSNINSEVIKTKAAVVSTMGLKMINQTDQDDKDQEPLQPITEATNEPTGSTDEITRSSNEPGRSSYEAARSSSESKTSSMKDKGTLETASRPLLQKMRSYRNSEDEVVCPRKLQRYPYWQHIVTPRMNLREALNEGYKTCLQDREQSLKNEIIKSLIQAMEKQAPKDLKQVFHDKFIDTLLCSTPEITETGLLKRLLMSNHLPKEPIEILLDLPGRITMVFDDLIKNIGRLNNARRDPILAIIDAGMKRFKKVLINNTARESHYHIARQFRQFTQLSQQENKFSEEVLGEQHGQLQSLKLHLEHYLIECAIERTAFSIIYDEQAKQGSIYGNSAEDQERRRPHMPKSIHDYNIISAIIAPIHQMFKQIQFNTSGRWSRITIPEHAASTVPYAKTFFDLRRLPEAKSDIYAYRWSQYKSKSIGVEHIPIPMIQRRLKQELIDYLQFFQMQCRTLLEIHDGPIKRTLSDLNTQPSDRLGEQYATPNCFDHSISNYMTRLYQLPG